MGSSLSTRFEWVDTIAGKPPLTKDGLPHLQTSIINQELLYDLSNMIEQLCQSYPIESKAEFRKPLVWNTRITPTTFINHSSASLWTIKDASKTHKSTVSSVGLRYDGQPLFHMEQLPNTDVPVYKAKVATFDYLHKFLQKLFKVIEFRSDSLVCRDPFSHIFGITGDPGKALVEAFDSFNNEVDPRKKDQYSKLYKLLLVVNSFDLQLMSSAVKDVSKANALDLNKVTEELEMLKSFCGRDSVNALVSIDWELDFTFTNGFKAPPWRQIYGEISYIHVQCHDTEDFLVTASKKGYFINMGYVADTMGNEQMNYESKSSTFGTLVELLRTTSDHFNSKIDSQGYIYHRDLARETGVVTVTTESADQMMDNNGMDNKQDRTEDGHKRNDKDVGKRTNVNKKKKAQGGKAGSSVEPSLKWRALGLSSAEQILKDRKSKGGDKKRQESSNKDGKKRLTKSYSFNDEEFEASDSEFNQLAIRDVGGLETIVNLLDTDDAKCRIGALQILRDTSHNVAIRSAIANLDGMQPLVELLKDSDENLKCLAAQTIAHCARNAKNRRAVRKYGGIRKLVKLLRAKLGTSEETVAISGALALETCSKSAKNKEAIQQAGAVPLLANLLHSTNEKLLIPVVGILQECASEESYRIAIRSSGMIRFLVENLSSTNEELQAHCASAIFKCAEEDETCVLVRQYNGITPLVSLLDSIANKDLLIAATGAVWKCAQNVENVQAFTKAGTIKKLVGLMENQPEDVLVNVVGALGACAQTGKEINLIHVAEGRQGIREGGGITPLVNLLTGTNQALLANVTKAVGASALDCK
ncbi:Armadillo repeat-containing protein 4 [Globomyces sp. JEL0801]|nr:Armadillo repeat-containing protein 4 [Globomyces sp. JEL0801]